MKVQFMNKTFLAADVGFGNTKLVFGREGESWSELCFKSVAPQLVANAAGLAGSLSPAFGADAGVGSRVRHCLPLKHLRWPVF